MPSEKDSQISAAGNPRTKPGRQSTMGALTELLGSFRELGYESCSLRIRTAAFWVENDWHNFATVGVLEPGTTEEEKRIDFRGDVVLFELCVPVKTTPKIEDLRRWFCRWRQVLKSPGEYALQDHVNLERQASAHDDDRWPQWRTNLHEQGRDRKNFSPPDGPFLNEQESMFAPNLPALAGYFLRGGRWREEGGATDANMLVIPDRRVRLGDLRIRDNVLDATVQCNTNSDLRLCAHAVSHTNLEFRKVVPINRKAKGRIELPFAPAELSLWITFADGYPLDEYIESLRRDRWKGGRGILRASPQAEVQKEILQVLQQGESDRVEFKPYVSFKQPTEKRDELLETVCGFANAKGGSLYIGVNNNALPVGIELGLREYNAECKGEPECLKERYIRDLQKHFAEGVTPSLPLEYQWRDIAHHLILEVRTPASPVPVGLLSGDAFQRVGATNRKILVHQLAKGKPNGKRSPFGFTSE